MLTFLGRISIIQGCSSIRQGEARRLGSFSRLGCEGYVSFCLAVNDVKGIGNSPALNEIFEVFAPLDTLVGFVF
jgi:hypothetical protein